jgi:hypothetical protein
MLGSSILDIAIGLVFVYLLLSLIVTAASEMIAAWLKRRHSNLWLGIVNLLGEGYAEKLYDHALIKGLSPPPSRRWGDAKGLTGKLQWLFGLANVDAGGPSYIPSRTFTVSLLDILGCRQDNGLEAEIRRVLESFPDASFEGKALKSTLLAAVNSSLAGGADAVREFQGFLLTIPDSASFSAAGETLQRFLSANPTRFGGLKITVDALVNNVSIPTLSAKDVKIALLQVLGSPPASREFARLVEYIPDSASVGSVKQVALDFLDKLSLVDPLGALPKDLQGTDLEKSLRLLWNEAEHDLGKFKQNIESWFNDAMDRVSGWYKRKTQLVNFTLAVVFTLAINVDTIVLVNSLSKNSALRDSLVARATKFAEKPPVELQLSPAAIQETTAPTADTASLTTNEPFSLSLEPNLVVSGEDVKGVLTLRETNGSDLTFDLSSSMTNLASVPMSITISQGQKSAEFPVKTRPAENSARVNIGVSNRVSSLQISPNPKVQFQTTMTELENLNLPIGWVLQTNKSLALPNVSGAQGFAIGTPTTASPLPSSEPLDRNHQLFLVLAPPTQRLFWRTIAFHWLGWALTAIAVSLGAPFWFDVLNKFITIRSSGKTPEPKPQPATDAPQPSEASP